MTEHKERKKGHLTEHKTQKLEPGRNIILGLSAAAKVQSQRAILLSFKQLVENFSSEKERWQLGE